MTIPEAKTILNRYRGSRDDAYDPEIIAALELARKDPGLRHWLDEQEALHKVVQAKFHQVPVPENLKDAIMARQKVVALPPPPKAHWLQAVAIAVLLVALSAVVTVFWTRPKVPDAFGDYQSRMVRSALREYRMDVQTNDLSQVLQLLTSRGAPSGFTIPKGLQRLELTGGGVLRWRNHPVSMVCYDRGDKQMVFLFVMDRSAVKDPPTSTPMFTKVSKLSTISWSEGNRTYLLAGPEDLDSLKKYL